MSISVDPIAPAGKSLDTPDVADEVKSGTNIRSRLFIKYVALFVAVVGVALLSNGIFEVFFYYREHKASLIRIQQEQAVAAAAKISQFIKEIESQLGWTTQLPWSTGSVDQHRFDALRLLRQVPAITELSQADATGKERLRVSRLAMDVVDSGLDLSADPKFAEAVAHKMYYGPVYFRRESEPYMTLSLAGNRRDAGVSIAEVNLKLIWDVVSQIKVGEGGHAYVVGAQGRLIAHPDISLVLRNTDMSKLPQVIAAQADGSAPSLQGARNVQGVEVLTAAAPIAPLGWTMFVELPVEEAYASLYQSLERLGVVLLGALVVAVLAGLLLAKRMVGPIRALRAGAARMGSGHFGQRISIKTGDELEGLANQFNDMAARLEESYSDLEKKVEVRTIELSESLQRQTATTDVLKVISRSTLDAKPDLAPVFETLLESAIRLCGATRGHVYRYDGEFLRYAASIGAWPGFKEWLQANPLRPGKGSIAGRAAVELRLCHIHDVELDANYEQHELRRHQAFRSALAVPMLRDGTLLGVIVILKSKVEPFTDKQIDLVTTFADQAVIAIENVRLFDEVQARTEDLRESLQQQTATADVLKVISRSAFDLKNVLHTLVKSAAQLSEADSGMITRQENAGFVRAEAFGLPPELLGIIKGTTVVPDRGSAAGRALLEGKVIHIPDVLADPEYTFSKDISLLNQLRTTLGIPMLREGIPIGVLTLSRSEMRPFSDKQIELVTTFADQAAIAIENSRLFEQVQERTKELSLSLDELRTAQDRLVQTEKLASLGQLTAGIAHEIKNPLNFVNNFAALSIELIDELNDALKRVETASKNKQEIDELIQMLKGNLEKVEQHGKRADSIVKNMLLHSREGSGDHRPVDINGIVEESLSLAYHGARAEKSGFNIALQRDLDPKAGMIDLYPQEITRVLLNLITNGFYAASKRKAVAEKGFEPTLSVKTKSLGETVEIRIRDNGTGIPDEVREKIFNPFFTTKPAGEGTGLGLSMSHDIVVKQHGGRIDVETQPNAFTEFIIVLPRSGSVLDNQGSKL